MKGLSRELKVGVLGGEVLNCEVYCLRDFLEEQVLQVVGGKTTERSLMRH